jgi:hypothetical protein
MVKFFQYQDTIPLLNSLGVEYEVTSHGSIKTSMIPFAKTILERNNVTLLQRVLNSIVFDKEFIGIIFYDGTTEMARAIINNIEEKKFSVDTKLSIYEKILPILVGHIPFSYLPDNFIGKNVDNPEMIDLLCTIINDKYYITPFLTIGIQSAIINLCPKALQYFLGKYELNPNQKMLCRLKFFKILKKTESGGPRFGEIFDLLVRKQLISGDYINLKILIKIIDNDSVNILETILNHYNCGTIQLGSHLVPTITIYAFGLNRLDCINLLRPFINEDLWKAGIAVATSPDIKSLAF